MALQNDGERCALTEYSALSPSDIYIYANLESPLHCKYNLRSRSGSGCAKVPVLTTVRPTSAHSLSVTTYLLYLWLFSLTGIETSCFGGSLLPTHPDIAPLSNPLSLSFYNSSQPFFLQLDLASTMHQPSTAS